MKIFLTGATGNLGSAILWQLLRNTEARLWVLIRASSDEAARERFREILRPWQLSDIEMEDVVGRVQVVKGDIGYPKFGLTDFNWQQVVSNCSHLIHAAGVVRMNLPIDVARRYAVLPAENLIALAEAVSSRGRSADLAFVSTVGIAGKRSARLLDEWVTDSRDFHNTYEQAKAEAEEVLRKWRRPPSIRLTVHRPSMVVGPSNGRLVSHQVFFYLCEFLSGYHTKGLQPSLADARLDTVPADYVAQAVCWAVQHPETDGKIFNLCSGSDQDVGLACVRDLVRQQLIRNGRPLPKIRSLPPEWFLRVMRLAALRSPSGLKRRLATLPFLVDYLQSPQIFEGGATRTYLKTSAGLGFPGPWTYLPEIVRSYYQQ